MSYGAAPRLGLHLRPTPALFLGLAAIIFGIIGMHILNVSHHASVPATSGHFTSAPAASAHAMHHAPATDKAIPSADTAAGILPADGCAGGPCAGDQYLMAAICVLMTLVAGFVLLFVLLHSFSSRSAAPKTPAPSRISGRQRRTPPQLLPARMKVKQFEITFEGTPS
ncbi:DUF6153 family protein [Arthrobacter crystallopoietes]|uniref:DUF6153 family protein n=1 Tax=Crystallibacter crystallopoietes TaxID=37928 RepID=UPI001ABEE6C3|nr:DUF6153 family protein [Arthrobacter crystallopoietes]QTG82744.1 hypothetical protein J5251_09600 [Arthrobacter crystallopoietes]